MKKKPNGASAKNMNPLLLLNIWAHHWNDSAVRNQDKEFVFAGLGKPSYPLNRNLALASATYWNQFLNDFDKLNSVISSLSDKKKLCDEIARHNLVIDYGLPEGDLAAREMMAQAMSKWYNNSISAENILFTVGGTSALKIIFKILRTEKKTGVIITPRPYYPAYTDHRHKNKFHFIDLLQVPGYRLTADMLKNAIKSVTKSDDSQIKAFLFCDPNNPLGSSFSSWEWKEIAKVLEQTPSDIPIILDEAYAEMVFHPKKHVSLLSVAPSLKERLIILRSATKSLSASGERMSIILCFNDKRKEEIIDEISFAYAHAPKSLQYAYAQAMLAFTEDDRQKLCSYYEEQIAYVAKRLQTMNAQMPDPRYQIDGSFYVLANLSALLGTSMSEFTARMLGKKSLIVKTDEEICYSLLFEENIMIAPLSYSGANPKSGFVRITCSNSLEKTKNMLDRIAHRLQKQQSAKSHLLKAG